MGDSRETPAKGKEITLNTDEDEKDFPKTPRRIFTIGPITELFVVMSNCTSKKEGCHF